MPNIPAPIVTAVAANRVNLWINIWGPQVGITGEESNLLGTRGRAGPWERPYRGGLGFSSGIYPEDSDGVPPFAWRQGTVHPLGMPMAYQDAKGRGNYLPEHSIKDVETWLDWQAHQMDTPHWWAELTAIPKVEDPKRLAQKICTSFQFQQLDARPSQAKGTLCPLPQVYHQEFVSPQWSVLLRHLTAAFSPDCGLHPSVTVLGREI